MMILTTNRGFTGGGFLKQDLLIYGDLRPNLLNPGLWWFLVVSVVHELLGKLWIIFIADLVFLFSILGFFFAGVVLNQFGVIRNLTDVKVLSEWGILFLDIVVGAALSLSSSAFVLQDIAVVPLLVILPVLESQDHRSLKELSRLFESMVVVGLHPNCDLQTLQRALLYFW